MNRQYHRPSSPRPVTTSTSALLGTSLLMTRSPRHNRALAGLLRAPTGRGT